MHDWLMQQDNGVGTDDDHREEFEERPLVEVHLLQQCALSSLLEHAQEPQ